MKKNIVKLTESQLHKVIKESVKRVLHEWDNDNDLNYNDIYDEACHFITNVQPSVQSWRGIAEAMGFRLNTCGPADMETLKDAIEDAMMDCCD